MRNEFFCEKIKTKFRAFMSPSDLPFTISISFIMLRLGWNEKNPTIIARFSLLFLGVLRSGENRAGRIKTRTRSHLSAEPPKNSKQGCPNGALFQGRKSHHRDQSFMGAAFGHFPRVCSAKFSGKYSSPRF
jgi:hypothetical protein